MNAPSPNGNATSLAALKERTKNLPPDTPLGFFSAGGLDLMQRAAMLLSNSTLVPTAYRDTIERRIDKYRTETVKNPNALSNCVLALNMAQRLGADPLMIMQHLYIVDGHPGWSSQFVISAINTCGKYSPLRFKMEELGEKEVEWKTTAWVDGPNGKRIPKEETHKAKIENKICTAWAIEKATGDKLEGPPVSMDMAVAEGWYGKNGSKWQTMPDIMLRYRAASFFGKLYAPELLMGLHTAEEEQDRVITVEATSDGAYEMTLDDLTVTPPHTAQEETKLEKNKGKRKEQPGPAQQEPAQAETKTTPQNDAFANRADPAGLAAGEGDRHRCVKYNQWVTDAECEVCIDQKGCQDYWPQTDSKQQPKKIENW